MALKQTKSNLAKIDWYAQGFSGKLFYILFPLYTCLDFRIQGKKIPVKFEICAFYTNNFVDLYLSKRSLKKVALYYYQKQKKNKNFVRSLNAFWHAKQVKPFLNSVQYYHTNTDFFNRTSADYTDHQLLNHLKKFMHVYLRVWHESIFLDGFDYYGDTLLDEILKKESESKNITPEDLDILLMPPATSSLQKERLSLLGITKKLKTKKQTGKNKHTRQPKASHTIPPWLTAALEKHARAYYWIENDYRSVHNLSTDYFYKKVIHLVSNAAEFKKDQELHNTLKTLKSKKRALYKKYNFSKSTIHSLEFLTTLVTMRDERKSYNQMGNSVLHQFQKALAKRTRLPLKTIEHLFPWEVKTLFSKHAPKRHILEKRIKDTFYLFRAPDRNIPFHGKRGQLLGAYMKQLIQRSKANAVHSPKDGAKNSKKSVLQKKLGQYDWYRQAGAVKLWYVSYPWYSCSLMRIHGKKIRLAYQNACVFYKNNYFFVYFTKQSLERVATYYGNRQKRDPRFIQKLFTGWHKNHITPFLTITDKILSDEFSGYTNHQLLQLFKKFTNYYRGLWHESIFLDSFDYYGDILLDHTLIREKKQGKKTIVPEDLDVLLQPPHATFLQKERLSLLNIAEKLIKKSNKTLRANPWLQKELQNHEHNYHWIENDYATIEHLDAKHFYKKILELIKNKAKLRDEQTLRNQLKTLLTKKKRIRKKYNLSPHTANTLEFLALLASMRDERKSYSQMAGVPLKKFARAFAKQSNTSLGFIENLFHWETDDIFALAKSKKRIETIKKRPQGTFYLFDEAGKNTTISGTKGATLQEFMTQLVEKESALIGRVAYPGKVQGTARIIKDRRDFYKMKKGDILVAPNTRPEYVPIMKIAAAIISDEGGLTCHSAIVSRELKIPCIVGVQTASSTLKDGDTVEVDAIKGVIRKL